MTKKGGLGIIVSGGPAPGINNVIFSSLVEATNLGWKVYGAQGGFEGINSSKGDAWNILKPEELTDIRFTGGSVLGTSRFNPFNDERNTKIFLNSLAQKFIDKLIIIGGEGSAYLSYKISKIAPEIQVIHVPKTIDNDLALPNSHPSFGFETARFVGTEILETLLVDAKTSKRWFIVTSMGRNAGFLALGLGVASGAHLTLIPEEFFDTKPTINDIADIIFYSIKKRADAGKNYGLAIIAEGVLQQIDPESHEDVKNCPRDDLGRLSYSRVEIGELVLPLLQEKAAKAKLNFKLYTKNLGYELRCHAPVSFDLEYTKFLGCGAVMHLAAGKSAIMVVRDYDKLSEINLNDLVADNNKMLSRTVNIDSDLYKIAAKYMFR